MKYLKLYEEIKNQKRCILVDGTSSAGKTYMTSGLKTKGWVIIGSDDFGGDSKLKIPFDHAGSGYDLKAGKEFHKQMLEERGEELGAPGVTNVAYQNHPKHKEFKKSGIRDPRVWYMYQDYLWGRGRNKNVIFDDISDDMLKLNPDCEHIILYTPIELLKENIISRFKKKDPRGTFVFSEQFVWWFEATDNRDDEDIIEYVSYTKDEIRDILNDKELVKAFGGQKLDIENFLVDLGLTKENKNYWIKFRQPFTGELVNTRHKDAEDLERLILKTEYFKNKNLDEPCN